MRLEALETELADDEEAKVLYLSRCQAVDTEIKQLLVLRIYVVFCQICFFRYFHFFGFNHLNANIFTKYHSSKHIQTIPN